MKRSTRPLLTGLAALVLAALSACGQPEDGSSDRAERNNRDAPVATAPAPQPGEGSGSAAPKSAEPPVAEAPAPAPTKPDARPSDPPVMEAPPEIIVEPAEQPAVTDEAPGPEIVAEAPEPEAAPPPPPPPAPAATPGAERSDTGTGLGLEGTGEGGGGASRGLGTIGAGGGAATDPNKTFDVVPVFYGTDRAVEPDAKRLNYGAERAHKLQLGRALVTVPLAHKVPAIERPWVIEIPYFKVKIYEETEDKSKHFTLQEIGALTKEQMLAFVKERLARSAAFKDHALVFVHGFNTSFDFALYRTAQIAYDLKFDGAPFVYSWPSGGKIASYTYDRGSAEQAEPHLAEFLEFVVKESGAKSISLIAHSMGNELLLRVLERMRPKAPDGVVISQVILAAPDVDRDKFQNIARQITDFAKGVTLYAAANDRALSYSARFWGGIPRAGDVPATGPLVIPGVDTIDVSAVSTDSLGLNHSGYAENNALLNDIRLLIQTGERPPDKRIPILQPMTTAAGGAYWRYPPAP